MGLLKSGEDRQMVQSKIVNYLLILDLRLPIEKQ
jgi:hypothetical protein